MGHKSEARPCSDASTIAAAVLAFAATGGDMAAAATTVSGAGRDRRSFVEAADLVDALALARPDDAELRRASELLQGLLRADIWPEVTHDRPGRAPATASEDAGDELAEVRVRIHRLLDRRSSEGLDVLDESRWARLTEREAVLLAERRAEAACA
jgi:hypothetical protein